MNIAIIGGGLTGLTAAYELLKSGHRVTVFEKEKTLGGLAGGFKPASRRGADASRGGMPNWNWHVEFFYHHFFTNDSTLISFAKELGLKKEMLILRPITATLTQNSKSRIQNSEFDMYSGDTREYTSRIGGPPSSPVPEQARYGVYARNNTHRMGDTSERSCKRPESRNCNENPEQAKTGMSVVRRLVRRVFGVRDEDVCGTRSWQDPCIYMCEDVEREKRMTGPVENTIYQLDSPMNLLTFPLFSPFDKLRTAALLAFCKLNPFWQPLEKITSEKFFKTIGGLRAWNTLWQPLMVGKFGLYAKDVPASWLWARFHKRTMRLGYFRGGFQAFVDTLADAIEERGGKICIKYQVSSIKYQKKDNHLSFVIGHLSFDKVLITTPSSAAQKLITFPKDYAHRLSSIPHLWAQTLILETKEPILKKTYWLNIADPTFPFVAVVAHTNMIDKKWYGGRHITYIGNYLPDNHPFLKMTKEQLLKVFTPYVQILNSPFNSEFKILNSELFSAPAAQPVHTLNYSKKVPAIQTPIDGIYLANLDSIYPWDRGTNYAVELGQKAARSIDNSKE